MNFGRVLVAVDFSSASRQALSLGISFARQFNARIDLLHVVDSRSLVGTLRLLERRLIRMVRLVPEDVEPRARLHLDVGVPAACIVSAAHACGVDAILLGKGRATTGRTLARVREDLTQAVIAVDEQHPLDVVELMGAVRAGVLRTGVAKARPPGTREAVTDPPVLRIVRAS
jgi:nucleotide-binding universal stress UspA family protein